MRERRKERLRRGERDAEHDEQRDAEPEEDGETADARSRNGVNAALLVDRVDHA